MAVRLRRLCKNARPVSVSKSPCGIKTENCSPLPVTQATFAAELSPQAIARFYDHARFVVHYPRAMDLDRAFRSRPRRWLSQLGIVRGFTLGSLARLLWLADASRVGSKLRNGVEKLGAGELSTRVPIQGNDEVADLAQSFNQAADRIDTLVKQQSGFGQRFP